jgi:putative flavoprotein involved in K+ transport
MFTQTIDKLSSPAERFDANPLLTGKNGGHSLNVHQFAQDGVTLLGRVQGGSDTKILIASDLMQNLAMMDASSARFKQGVDGFIEKSGLQAPPDDQAPEPAARDYEILSELDLDTAGIRSIIWAAGYTYDFGWLRFPILDEAGYPIQQRGLTAYPGLYFVGLHWLHTRKSALLLGVGDDAAYIASQIAGGQ